MTQFLLISSSSCMPLFSLLSWLFLLFYSLLLALSLSLSCIQTSPIEKIPWNLVTTQEEATSWSCQASSELAQPKDGCLWLRIQYLESSAVGRPTESDNIKHGYFVQQRTVLNNLHLPLQIHSLFFSAWLCANLCKLHCLCSIVVLFPVRFN